MKWCLLLLMVACTGVFAADADERFLAPYAFVATGSGVIVSADGEILTNNHVIADVCSPLNPALTIRLPGVGEIAAVLVATDPVGDLALVRITGKTPPLTPAPLAERMPPPGTLVIAVGNPFALGDLDDRPSVSRGVMGTGRVVRGSYPDCVQHDAPVNPGNSGGPLYDDEGHLLGINGAIRSRSGFRINSGIGLAIAAPQLALFLPALREAGTDHGGYLRRSAAPAGVRLDQTADGVAVMTAVPPLLVGDVLLTIDGRLCPAVETATGLFAGRPWRTGLTLPVTLRRAGSELTVAVGVDRAPLPGRAWHGLTVSERAGQVLLEQVDPNGPTGHAGALAGDALLSVNGAAIASRLDLLRATAPLGVGDRLELRVRRTDGSEHGLTCFLAPEPESR